MICQFLNGNTKTKELSKNFLLKIHALIEIPRKITIENVKTVYKNQENIIKKLNFLHQKI